MGILKIRFFVSARQKVIWSGVIGLTLNLISWAGKGYMSTSKIKTFESYVKQNVLIGHWLDMVYLPLEGILKTIIFLKPNVLRAFCNMLAL